MIRCMRVMSVGFLISCSFLRAQQASAQGTDTPKATPKTVAWGYYDRKAAPVLLIKSGDTGEIPTPVASPAAQEEEQPIVYVKHLESPVRYPPLARQARLTGTIVIKLTIAADGTVLKTESSVGDKNTIGFDLLKDDAERIVKSWTFGCAGCSPHAPFEHTIKFIYKREDSFTAPSLRVVMNLPDEVTISTDAVVVQPSNNSKKGSH
jgi:Gram-negative bacterial TonB protein C-terminal